MTELCFTLPREVFRWLQSLDMTYPVKNIRRDFSNGFLIADICSKYFPKYISSRSFQNGTAISIKKDNWIHLTKFLEKLALVSLLDVDLINRIINCEEGFAMIFICRLYEVLTKRKLQEIQRNPTSKETPHYAENTSSYSARSKIEYKSELENTSNDGSLQDFVPKQLLEHAKNLNEERHDKESKAQSMKRATRVPTHSVQLDAIALLPVPVKQIKVKQIEVIDFNKANDSQLLPENVACCHDSQSKLATVH